MNCTRVEELEDSYLLGELEGEEAAELEQHLGGCLACSSRITAQEEILGRMFAAVKPIAPPVAVRSALLEKVATLPQNTLAPVIPIQERRRKQIRWPASIGIAASVAAAIIVGLSLWAFNLLGDLDAANSQRIEAQRLFEYTSSADTRVWTMLTEDKGNLDAPRARMYIRPGVNYFIVTASKLSPPPNGETYKVWMVRNSNGQPQKPEFVANLKPDSQGRSLVEVSNPSGSDDINSCFVTLESPNSMEPVGPELMVWYQS
jgi:hypothetical protein